jgi:AP-3 complex subunit sigma
MCSAARRLKSSHWTRSGFVVETGREKVVEGVEAQGKFAKRPVNSSRPGIGAGMWTGR